MVKATKKARIDHLSELSEKGKTKTRFPGWRQSGSADKKSRGRGCCAWTNGE